MFTFYNSYMKSYDGCLHRGLHQTIGSITIYRVGTYARVCAYTAVLTIRIPAFQPLLPEISGSLPLQGGPQLSCRHHSSCWNHCMEHRDNQLQGQVHKMSKTCLTAWPYDVDHYLGTLVLSVAIHANTSLMYVCKESWAFWVRCYWHCFTAIFTEEATN